MEQQQAGSAGQDRVQTLGNYLSDVMRQTSLEDWMEDHGGWVSVWVGGGGGGGGGSGVENRGE